MKTPREILLEQHQSAEDKLDAIRQKALENLTPARALESVRGKASHALPASWLDFLLSLRWHLAGMSALWLLGALLNASGPAAPDTAVARNTAPSPRQVLTALRENRLQLLELTEPPAAEPDADAAPPRRGELPIFNALT
jgi:hypothetical protein